MSAMVVIGAVWVALALVLAVVLSGAIRLADRKEALAGRSVNFAVDGDPFDAPLPAIPVAAGAAASSTASLPLARRPLDDR